MTKSLPPNDWAGLTDQEKVVAALVSIAQNLEVIAGIAAAQLPAPIPSATQAPSAPAMGLYGLGAWAGNTATATDSQ